MDGTARRARATPPAAAALSGAVRRRADARARISSHIVYYQTL